MDKIKLTSNSIFRREIRDSLNLFNFCCRMVGLSGINDACASLCSSIFFFICSSSVLLLLSGELLYLVELTRNNLSSVAEFAAQLHLSGYGTISLAKAKLLWDNRFLTRLLVDELEGLWSITIGDREARNIKQRSTKPLHFVQLCYTFSNVAAVWLYNLTPLVLYVYSYSRGQSSGLGFAFNVAYPFIDIHAPVYHAVIYAFQAFAAQSAVWFMVCADILFTTMTSHLSMLLRQLQHKIENISVDHIRSQSTKEQIKFYVKIHQRIITYGKNLEDAFSAANLINILLSSVDICCAVFTIVLLEPWLYASNKTFLVAATAQMGILCWYADEVFRASVGVANSAYNSLWYNFDVPSRKYLLTLIQRSQKPIYFTAMKFSNITLATYASILTSAYSYFTLLYTVNRKS